LAKNASRSTITTKSEKQMCQRKRRFVRQAPIAAIAVGIKMNARRLFCFAMTHQYTLCWIACRLT